MSFIRKADARLSALRMTVSLIMRIRNLESSHPTGTTSGTARGSSGIDPRSSNNKDLLF
jgi:hypothetical protein